MICVWKGNNRNHSDEQDLKVIINSCHIGKKTCKVWSLFDLLRNNIAGKIEKSLKSDKIINQPLSY